MTRHKPDDQTSIPLFLSTADARAEGFDNDLMREVLALPGLRGLQVSREESVFRCMERFAEIAADVQHLSLVNLTKAKPAVRLLEQLVGLQRLRTLHLVGFTPKERIAPLASHPTLRTLILFSANLTDDDLRPFCKTQALRVCLIGDGAVTRRGVKSLREANPRLKVILGDDLRWAPG